VLLLRAVADTGATLRYHGDLDGPGLRIAAHVMAKTGASAWRMSADDYRAGLGRRDEGPTVGRVPDAPWDDRLAPAMRASGVAVTEESILDLLMNDLEGSD